MFMLNKGGILLSVLLGILIYYLGGIESLALIFSFLIFSVFVTRFGYYEKKEMGIYEYERGWKNVLSNGIVPVIALFLYSNGVVPILAYIGSVAAITADKFSSEIGVFDEKPIYLLTMKEVKPGTNGAVSPLGLFSSLIGAFLIAVVAYFLYSISYFDMLIVIIAGFAGSFADSLAGTLEEKGIGTKETSNIVGSIVGFLLCSWRF